MLHSDENHERNRTGTWGASAWHLRGTQANRRHRSHLTAALQGRDRLIASILQACSVRLREVHDLPRATRVKGQARTQLPHQRPLPASSAVLWWERRPAVAEER